MIDVTPSGWLISTDSFPMAAALLDELKFHFIDITHNPANVFGLMFKWNYFNTITDVDEGLLTC